MTNLAKQEKCRLNKKSSFNEDLKLQLRASLLFYVNRKKNWGSREMEGPGMA